MKIQCSRGHEFDTKKISTLGQPREGDRCPMELSYDRMSGSRYCGRILRKPIEKPKDSEF